MYIDTKGHSFLNISLDIDCNIGITGPSGCGKSSLANYILNKYSASLVFQDPLSSLNPTRTIRKQLNDISSNYIHLAQLFKLPLDCYPQEISIGTCQKVCIVQALLTKADVILFDEASAYLDRNSKDILAKLIKNIEKSIFISHDLDFLNKVSDKIFYLNNGELDVKSY